MEIINKILRGVKEDGLLFKAKSFDPIFSNMTLYLSLSYIQEEIPQFIKDHPEYFI